MPGTAPLRDMFVQIIEAPVADAGQVEAVYRRWFEDLAPGADGWLASTAGITEEGTFIAVVRFASQEAARRNSQRDEQGAWWDEMTTHLADEAVFHDSLHAATFGDGRPDDAGFVHIIRGKATDLEGAHARVAAEQQHHVNEHHLPVLGGLLATYGNGGFTELIYYPSEEEARDREGGLPREGVMIVERVAGSVIDARHLHLRDPWLHRR